MIKRIITSRAAALAFAAPLLFTVPALADHGKSHKHSGSSVSLHFGSGGVSVKTGKRYGHTYGRYGDRGYTGYQAYRGYNSGHRGYGSISYGSHKGYGYRRNAWGQSRWEVRDLRRRAVHDCVQAIRAKGFGRGFRDIDFDDDIRARQVGPFGFSVFLEEVEFEGRRREFERDIRCEVRKGRVVGLEGVPQPGRRGHAYGHRGHKGYGY
ncbi:MAG: hypothetical protein AAGF20_02290 [Pseudomonadota bacterium]